MILTHGANSIGRAAPTQGWTKENVPTGVQITHDFGDGAGAVPAIPTDATGVRNDVISVTRYDVHVESCGVRNDIISVELI